MIYFIRSPEGLIKIGYTGNPSQRLKQLRHGNPSLDVMAILDGERPAEQRLHARFAHLRVTGEWFSAGEELVAFIGSEGRRFDLTDPEHSRKEPRGEGKQEQREQERLVLAFLASLSDEGGCVGGDLSYRKIATRCNLGVASARPAIDRLRAKGHVVEFDPRWERTGARFILADHPGASTSLNDSLRCRLFDETRRSVEMILERLAVARA